MSQALLLAALCVVQEVQQETPPEGKRSLAWSFRPGQATEMTWKMQMRIEGRLDGKEAPRTDATMALDARFEVEQVSDDGAATGLLRQRRWVMQGRFQGGAEMDILVEDGKIVKTAAPPTENAKKLLDSALTPIKARVTPTGRLELDQQHPFSAAFGGQGVSLGPGLPEKPVAPGDSWVSRFRLAQAERTGGPEISLKHTFTEMAEVDGRTCARIKVDEKQKAADQGIEATYTIRIEALFDVKRRECFRSSYSADFVGSGDFRGQKLEMTGHSKLEFESKPAKK